MEVGKLDKIGRITHFFTNINVAVVELDDTLNAGDTIKIQGETTDLEMNVDSMQIDHENVKVAEAGQSVGLKVPERVRPNDDVFRV